jgi:phosphatidylserine/phosphatidylglycerophosphate/cardiolipin synthase-like enzyme
MNLTDHPEVRRDYGVEINDPDVIREMETVFNADILNSQNQTGETPQVSDPHLLWSPINSNEKLHDLISSATTSIVAVAENVLDTSIVQDLIDAAARGVNVEVLSPACPLGGHPDGNYQTSLKLKAGGVSVRQMPDPATPTTPYLHGKMMVIDNARAYVGSINYSYNSMHRARELGIALEDRAVVKGLSDAFAADYQNALEVGKALPNCAK